MNIYDCIHTLMVSDDMHINAYLEIKCHWRMPPENKNKEIKRNQISLKLRKLSDELGEDIEKLIKTRIAIKAMSMPLKDFSND